MGIGGGVGALRDLTAPHSDIDKIYAKEVDEYLEDSDWDVDSLVAPGTIPISR
jgi:hypothetical protein